MKRNTIWIVLIFGILLLGIGYAALSSHFQINGISTINNPSWNIYWNNIRIKEGSVTDVTQNATITPGKTEVNFNIKLKNPGDYYEFTVDAVNNGSIDAMIGSFSKGVYETDGITTKALPDYLEYTVTYGDNSLIDNKQLLSANSTATYKVRVYYKKDINVSQLPETDDNYVFKFKVNYEQADATAINVLNSFCPGCVFLLDNIDEDFYYGENGSVLTDDQYTDDYTETIPAGEEACFIGMKLDNNKKVEKAYNCVVTPQTPVCIDITTTSQAENSISYLLSNNMFTIRFIDENAYRFNVGENTIVSVGRAGNVVESYAANATDYFFGDCIVFQDDIYSPYRFGHYSN